MTGALIFGLLLIAVAEGRTPNGKAAAVRSLFADSANAICGGSQIRDMLTQDVSVERIRNMPWSTILLIADNYIRSQTSHLEKLAAEIDRLNKLIPVKQKAEAPTDLSVDQMRDLITNAVQTDKGFGDIEAAKDSKCGVVRLEKARRIPSGAYRKVKAAFRAAAKTIFDTKEYRGTADATREFCLVLLPGDAVDSGKDESNCDELCQAFGDTVQELSDIAVGARAGSTSDQLMVQLNEAENDLEYQTKELRECEEAKVVLTGFMEQLEELQDVIRVEVDNCQDAREMLTDAEIDLEEFQDDLKDQEGVLAEAMTVAEGSGEQLTIAKETLAGLQSAKQGLDADLLTTKNQLMDARLWMKKAQASDAAVKTLKEALATVMLKMTIYVDEAVKLPVRTIGLDAETDVEQLFRNPSDTFTAGKVKQTVDQLEALCARYARPIFNEVIDVVDLNPLCAIGTVATIEQEIDDAVAERIKAIQAALKRVQDLLDTHKNQERLSSQEMQQRNAAGEPQGLREIADVYGETDFYKYLIRWEFTEGDFLKLYGQLGASLEKLGSTIEELKAAEQKLTADLEANVQQINLAADSLQAAVKNDEIQQAGKAEAERVLNGMRDKAIEMQNRIDLLRRQLEEALAKYEAAKVQLETTHAHGTNMMEKYMKAGTRDLAVGSSGKLHRIQ